MAQGGVNFSGGQKQRLCIARAIVRRPDVYIFDDSFSALDFKTDAKLRAALKREVSDAVMIVVAQRVNTILDADLILVMDEGKKSGKRYSQGIIEDLPGISRDCAVSGGRGGNRVTQRANDKENHESKLIPEESDLQDAGCSTRGGGRRRL